MYNWAVCFTTCHLSSSEITRIWANVKQRFQRYLTLYIGILFDSRPCPNRPGPFSLRAFQARSGLRFARLLQTSNGEIRRYGEIRQEMRYSEIRRGTVRYGEIRDCFTPKLHSFSTCCTLITSAFRDTVYHRWILWANKNKKIQILPAP